MNYKKIIPVLFLFSISINLIAKTNYYHIDNTLKNAKTIKPVVITEYKENDMYYKFLDTNSNNKIDCSIKNSSEKNRLELIKLGQIDSSYLSGKWPNIGDTLLIVIGQNNKVDLFATFQNDFYRFWDPNTTIENKSICIFNETSQFKKVNNCDCRIYKNKEYYHCSDGCIAPIDYINSFIRMNKTRTEILQEEKEKLEALNDYYKSVMKTKQFSLIKDNDCEDALVDTIYYDGEAIIEKQIKTDSTLTINFKFKETCCEEFLGDYKLEDGILIFEFEQTNDEFCFCKCWYRYTLTLNNFHHNINQIIIKEK